MRTICYQIPFLLFFIVAALVPFGKSFAQQPTITYSNPEEVDKEQAKWNSHINNQAYLQELKERRRIQAQQYPHGNTTIIIKRDGYRDCYYRSCDSWGVQYQSGDTSFSYQEGYQPTEVYPIIIVPTGKKRYSRSPYHDRPPHPQRYPGE